MVDWAAARLRAVCTEVVVAAGSQGVRSSTRCVGDGAGRGPMAGILGAARAAPGRSLLVMACDLPLVRIATLERLCAMQSSADAAEAVIAWDTQRWHPLLGLYPPAALAVLEQAARRGDFALYRLLRGAEIRAERLVLSPAVKGMEAATGPPGGLPDVRELLNLNTPGDVARLQGLLAK
jgi:molybdopterin-guanine dinucleotide biosynthesis protein A